MTTPGRTGRAAELEARLDAVRSRVDGAARAVGRSGQEVTIVVVTKTWPAEDVRTLAGLGVREVGENRDQEAAEKAAACSDLPLTWHFVGQLQTNKVRSVAGYADAVHSVDRLRLVRALSAAAVEHGRTVRCLLQVDLTGVAAESGLAASRGELAARGGADPAELAGLAEAVEGSEGLELAGLMAVAPLTPAGEPAAQRRLAERAFGRLAELSERLQETHPQARWISAGMSQDLEEAVRAGATHVRIGSAVLGSRPRLR